MYELTEEDRKRIEENRKQALAKRAARAQQQNTNSSSLASDLSGKNIQNKIQSNSTNSNNVTRANQILTTKANAPIASTSATAYKPHVSSASNKSEASNKTCSQFYTNAVTNSFNRSVAFPARSKTNANSLSTSNYVFSKKSDTQLKGTMALLTSKRFLVEVGYHKEAIEIFKVIPSRAYDSNTKRWNFAIEDHDILVTKLKTLQPNVLFSPLPKNLIKLFSNASNETNISFDLSSLDAVLLNALMPFQKEGVYFGIQKNGKVLVADDMGLGKTIQAIAISNYYRSDWPLLVVTPSSMRYSWAESFRTWLPSFAHEVEIINSGKDYITKNLIVIISYDMLTKRKDDILRRNFKSVILDESHFLKNLKSARTKAALHIIKSMRRIIMLTGTPALSRPIELFPQISALNSTEFFSFVDFGIRYCGGKKMAWGWDFNGSSNMEELQLLLRETVMIRRLKSEVMKQLPSKIRQVVVLDTVQEASKNKLLTEMSRKMASASLKGMERRGVLLQYFHQSGMIKLPSICEYIKERLEKNQKFICFAHHQYVLDGISDAIDNAKIDYIRIDGSTPSERRKVLCDKFQQSDNCKVAVLSITAANSGLTLTSAQLVIFAELFWNPGILTQAEDRAHRIGQEDSVIVQYLVAKGTADDEIWPLVQKKLDILKKAGLSKDNFKDSETLVSENSTQLCLDDFWEDFDIVDIEASDSTKFDVPSKRRKFP